MADKKVEDFLARNKVLENIQCSHVSGADASLRTSSISWNRHPYKPLIPHNGGCVTDKVAVCCVDARLWPEDFFQLSKSEASVIRNAGGRAMDAMRSLLTLDALVGLGTIIVVHHTDCGLTHATDEGIRNRLKEVAPEHANEIDGMKFGEIKNLTDTVREDMALIKASPYFKNDLKMLGYIFDLEKGTLAGVTQK